MKPSAISWLAPRGLLYSLQGMGDTVYSWQSSKNLTGINSEQKTK